MSITNDLDRNVRAAIMRALLAAKGPMTDTALKQYLRIVFAHIAFTEATLEFHIRELEEAGMLCGVNDEIVGIVWDLTLKGKTRALNL